MIETWLDILHWYHHEKGQYEVYVDRDGNFRRKALIGFLNRCNHNIFWKIEGKQMILWKH